LGPSPLTSQEGETPPRFPCRWIGFVAWMALFCSRRPAGLFPIAAGTCARGFPLPRAGYRLEYDRVGGCSWVLLRLHRRKGKRPRAFRAYGLALRADRLALRAYGLALWLGWVFVPMDWLWGAAGFPCRSIGFGARLGMCCSRDGRVVWFR